MSSIITLLKSDLRILGAIGIAPLRETLFHPNSFMKLY